MDPRQRESAARIALRRARIRIAAVVVTHALAHVVALPVLGGFALGGFPAAAEPASETTVRGGVSGQDQLPTKSPPPVGLIEPAMRDDAGRFTNSDGPRPHGTLGVRLPFFLRRVGGAFRDKPNIPERLENDGQEFRTHSKAGQSSVTWIGHATVLIEIDGVTVLTDPIWSNTPSPIPGLGPRRFVAPGMRIEDLPRIDFVVISHNHYDHLDLPTLERLALRDPDTLFLVPLGNSSLLRDRGILNVRELNWGDRLERPGLTIYCLPAQHWSKRGVGDDNKMLWASWAVIGREKRFYFAGDTGFFPGFAHIGEVLGPFDLAAVPVGAYEPVEMMRYSHMNPEEAVAAAEDVGAKRALAIHFGTFDLSDEPLADPPKRFRDAAREGELGEEGAWVFSIGEIRPF